MNHFSKIIFLISTLLFCIIPQKLIPKEIVISKTGSVKTIKHAVASANDGDVIILSKGYYAEGNIIINKSITIKGTGEPVVDGLGEGEIFTVTANNVKITGLIIKNSGISYLEENAGIRLSEVSGCVISECKFVNNFFAVYLAKSSNCVIKNNTIIGERKKETNSGNGIHLWYCRDIEIKNNIIQNHRDGIYFEFVRNGRISENKSKNNLRYGLHFMFSDSCEYKKNIFERNGAGVAVMYTKNVLMENNIFSKNQGTASYGMLLKDISDSRIYRNHFEDNTTGIYVEGCNRLIISENSFSSNGWAIKLMANSMDNLFTNNNFVSNSFDITTNSKQNFNTFEFNYWSKYNGYDLNKDGIGDVPFRPVTMFSQIIQDHPESIILLNSLFMQILDIAERVVPALTPNTLMDTKPKIKMIK